MRKISIILVVFFLSSMAIAQDPHFSQFFASPLTLNPALTGKFDGTLRVAGNYRNQLPTFNNVYTTSTLSVDFSILNKIIPETDTWGVGIIALTDKAGNGVLTNNYIGISTSYHKALNEDGFSQIGIGFQGMYGQKRLDFTKLFFQDQLTPFGYNLSIPSADIANIVIPNISYLDVNAGIIYTTSTTDKNNFYLGASMYHINRPKESFEGGDFTLNPRTTISAGGYFPVSDILTLHTSGIYQIQSSATEVVFGGALSTPIDVASSNASNIYAGAWLRLKDAIIPYIGLEFAGMRIGASYDINTSSLKAGSESRGGMELSLIYVKKPADGKNIPCPKF
ncbi:MAG: PorP/SprF family type IX secretion system membrane protein [Chitinophagaceae bacterium]